MMAIYIMVLLVYTYKKSGIKVFIINLTDRLVLITLGRVIQNFLVSIKTNITTRFEYPGRND